MSRIARIDPERYALPPETIERLLSPALVIYLDRVRDNLQRVLARLDGRVELWRPHVKTLKIPEVYAELIRAGLRGFKCATLREARCLSRTLADEHVAGGDVLVAHPLVGPGLEGLGALARSRPETRFSVLCEDPTVLDQIPVEVDVFADINSGMDRTGIPLDDSARALAIARLAGDRFRGIHAYDGHLCQPDREERRAAVHACYDSVAALAGQLTEAGVRVPEIVTAGTPTFLDALDYRGFSGLRDTVHRLSPGTVVYHDQRSEEQNPELHLEPAALVFCRVVSLPRDDVVTVDAGSKSIAADAGDPCAVALGQPDLEALTPSEEHLPFRLRRGQPPARGTPLLLVPRHVCPTVNLAEKALLVDGGDARQLVPVAARAHDTFVEP